MPKINFCISKSEKKLKTKSCTYAFSSSEKQILVKKKKFLEIFFQIFFKIFSKKWEKSAILHQNIFQLPMSRLIRALFEPALDRSSAHGNWNVRPFRGGVPCSANFSPKGNRKEFRDSLRKKNLQPKEESILNTNFFSSSTININNGIVKKIFALLLEKYFMLWGFLTPLIIVKNCQF